MPSTHTENGYCRIINFGANPSELMDLAELCENIAWDEDARVVVLIFDSEIDKTIRSNGFRPPVKNPIDKLKQPVIAAIQGNAIGISLEMALACDIRIGGTNAQFGLNQIKEGNIPFNGGTQRLPRLVGIGKALEMILTGESIDALEACRTGLIHRAVASESVVSTAMEMAREMAAKSPLSLSYVKEALYSGRDLKLDQGIKMELDLYLLLFTTSDRVEGISAFRDKRKPRFRGN